MLNVYDIKRNKNLNFILPLKDIVKADLYLLRTSVLIVIHLFYIEKVEGYLKYVRDIPDDIDILFVTSSNQVKAKVSDYMDALNKKYKVIEKENRGRDVSAFLVACPMEILNYKYVCFLHDKREKSEYTKKDTEIFERCLWDNMIGSGAYITNIIRKFDDNPELGLLLPPESVSDNFSFFFKNTWDQDFELMCSLARKLKLKCDLDKDKKPLSLGTVFWARVDAIRKLLEMQWRYEDFDEEPLAGDGTISHAIERSFAYIAQDAGYDTGIVMTDRFAGERMDYLQKILTASFNRLEKSLDICSVYELEKTNLIYKSLTEFAEKCSSIYIYGAGYYGKRCAKLLHADLYKIKGFVVSDKERNKKRLGDVPIIPISELELERDSGIIIAVSEKVKEEIMKNIEERFPLFNNIFYFSFLK